MLLIEGADNVGKTTLIQQLRQLDPMLRVLHRDRFRPGRGETLALSYARALLPKSGDHVVHSYGIADRFFASECIYGALFRGGCSMTPAEHDGVLRTLARYDPIVVHCDAPDDVITSSWASREQLYNDPLCIAKAYRAELSSIFNGFEIIRYDFTKPDAAAQREMIVMRHQSRWRSTQPELSMWSFLPESTGGGPHPDVMFVTNHAPDGIPFLRGPDAELLAEVLSVFPIAQRIFDLRITPAYRLSDPDFMLLREEVTRFLRSHADRGSVPLLIGLGPDVYKTLVALAPWCEGLQQTLLEMAHPKFICRFRPQLRDEYITEFRQRLGWPTPTTRSSTGARP